MTPMAILQIDSGPFQVHESVEAPCKLDKYIHE
jgi:hypothetical protein